MSREKEGFREQYAALLEMFEGKAAISVAEAAKALGVSEDALRADTQFPQKRIGRRVVVPLMAMARWMC